jgi:hypothetical protein
MTLSEFRKLILDTQNADTFNSIEASFNFNYINNVISLKGITAIYEYVSQQYQGWLALGVDLPSQFIESREYFQGIIKALESFVTNYGSSASSIQSNWPRQVGNKITIINQGNNVFHIPYNIPEVEFLLKINRDFPDYYLGAYNLLIRNDMGNIANVNHFMGSMMAYEFKQKGNTDILSRRDVEKSSLTRIRNDFQKYLTDSESQIVTLLKESDDKYSEYVKSLNILKDNRDKEFQEWFNHTKTEEWDKWYTYKQSTLSELESTYKEHLKLKEPATYWLEKSKEYRCTGIISIIVLLIIVSLSCLFLGNVLVKSPDWIFINVFKGNEIATAKWTIIFFTLIALIAFTIKAITKYMFSSFHLARDAEERHTLTVFYLSLIKDSTVKDEDRNLILQSLFSRTDTGLLKDDGSPTLPTGDIINKFTGGHNKN